MDSLEFAIKLKLVRVEGNQVLPLHPEVSIERKIKDELFTQSKEYQTIWDFLNGFFDYEGEWICYLQRNKLIELYDERRFLEQIGIVEVDKSGAYRITDSEVLLYLQTNNKGLSISTFMKQLRKQEEIGEYAEKAVLAYELNEKNKFPLISDVANIRQVSKENVCAGYDIISFCREDAAIGRFSPIFIEVKAVSDSDNEFFWSKNEMSMAKRFNERYYIYLVTIKVNEENHSIEIIRNPNIALLNSDEWVYESEVIHFWKA
jgi:hypothetical protein